MFIEKADLSQRAGDSFELPEPSHPTGLLSLSCSYAFIPDVETRKLQHDSLPIITILVSLQRPNLPIAHRNKARAIESICEEGACCQCSYQNAPLQSLRNSSFKNLDVCITLHNKFLYFRKKPSH